MSGSIPAGAGPPSGSGRSRPIAPRPARGSLGRRVKGCAAKPCRLRPQAGICDPCIDAPGFGRLSNSLSEGFNDRAKTLKKACCGLSNFERLRKRTFLIFDKTAPENEGDSKNRQTPGKVGEPKFAVVNVL